MTIILFPAPVCEVDTDPARYLAPPRELVYVAHTREPSARQPFACQEWRLERRLSVLWDTQCSPYDVLDLFAPERAFQASLALDELFDAADAVWASERQGPGSLPLTLAMDQHGDALYALAQILRGAR